MPEGCDGSEDCEEGGNGGSMVGTALCVSEGDGTMLSVVGSTPLGPKVMALSVGVDGKVTESGVCVVSGVGATP